MAAMQLLSVTMTAANRLRATFSTAPLAASPLNVGDILDPGTCSIASPKRAAYTILATEALSATIWEFVTLEPFEDFRVSHTLDASDLLDSTGAAIDSGYKTASCLGLTDNTRTPQQQAVRLRDVSNPQTYLGSPTPSTLQVSSSGDYSEDVGDVLLRKLVIRRLLTRPGGFFHLPNYGLGFDIKKPPPLAGDVAKLKAKIAQQIMLEPEAKGVTVSLIVGNGPNADITEIDLAIKTASGRIVPVNMPLANQ